MTNTIHFTGDNIDAAAIAPAGQRPGADQGDPQLRVLSVAAASGGRIGIWECQPGGWPVVDRQDTEFAYVLSGRARITDAANGQSVEVTAGGFVVLPKGWSGRWDVIETVKKIYVIY